MAHHEPITFTLAGFEMRVLGRQYPDEYDEWDGNWLNVECECKAHGGVVRTHGAFVSVWEVGNLARQRDKLVTGKSHPR
jgi:hypothetical protein